MNSTRQAAREWLEANGMMWKGLAVSTRSTTDHELIEMDDLVSRFFDYMTKARQPVAWITQADLDFAMTGGAGCSEFCFQKEGKWNTPLHTHISPTTGNEAQQPKRLTEDEIDRLAYDKFTYLVDGRRIYSNDPGSPEWESFKDGLRYARDQDYLGGLTVDEVMEAVGPYLDWSGGPLACRHRRIDLRASLASKLSQR